MQRTTALVRPPVTSANADVDVTACCADIPARTSACGTATEVGQVVGIGSVVTEQAGGQYPMRRADHQSRQQFPCVVLWRIVEVAHQIRDFVDRKGIHDAEHHKNSQLVARQFGADSDRLAGR